VNTIRLIRQKQQVLDAQRAQVVRDYWLNCSRRQRLLNNPPVKTPTVLLTQGGRVGVPQGLIPKAGPRDPAVPRPGGQLETQGGTCRPPGST